jgi:hypothetical protein
MKISYFQAKCSLLFSEKHRQSVDREETPSMKTRAFLTIAFLLFLILPLLLFWFASPAFVATPPLSHAPAVASPTVTPTPTPQTLGEKITQSEKNVFDPIVALLNYGAAVLITVLVLFLLWRIWHLSSLSNLVIDPFNNATGDEALGKALPGFNQLTREKLKPVLTKVHRHFNTFKAPDLDPLKPFPVPKDASDTQLTNLVKSLTEVASGAEKTVVQLLNLVFLPRGTRGIITLQSLGDTPPKLGISLQVVDLGAYKILRFGPFGKVRMSLEIVIHNPYTHQLEALIYNSLLDLSHRLLRFLANKSRPTIT